jgi:hypothetical protein
LFSRNELDGAEKNLDDCLDKWGDFETGKDNFSDWMNKTAAFLKGNIPLQPTLEDKKSILEKYQVGKNPSPSKSRKINHTFLPKADTLTFFVHLRKTCKTNLFLALHQYVTSLVFDLPQMFVWL